MLKIHFSHLQQQRFTKQKVLLFVASCDQCYNWKVNNRKRQVFSRTAP